jgi:hypothetical protein
MPDDNPFVWVARDKFDAINSMRDLLVDLEENYVDDANDEKWFDYLVSELKRVIYGR